ncbi:MAG TPA: type II toxin-antitoxin system VapC family toxin [bacterium]|nr:type II toxin-antitoxin system VapC family toxin [bacterium]HMY34976.1 type II toxin-antitoxin system VapC family toxin [bacterium]HMZ03473.1 type II toxin-antitoxin system VapC family toxin [bacterium]HNB08000.1 type II toxin-antitoxin system VapC family toxin [bacterium]HNB56738.1 type II toxin-antitoxin system VapC family toxin [bacterium]
MKNNRVYVDTSVFGGMFDPEFERASKTFFEQIKEQRFSLVISPTVADEISLAPENVKMFFEEMLAYASMLTLNPEATQLQKAYLNAGILSKKSEEDALHVALASVSECSMIISWNFKHIVHFEKIPMYNAVNILNGYGPIIIFSPMEVIENEEF